MRPMRPMRDVPDAPGARHAWGAGRGAVQHQELPGSGSRITRSTRTRDHHRRAFPDRMGVRTRPLALEMWWRGISTSTATGSVIRTSPGLETLRDRVSPPKLRTEPDFSIWGQCLAGTCRSRRSRYNLAEDTFVENRAGEIYVAVLGRDVRSRWTDEQYRRPPERHRHGSRSDRALPAMCRDGKRAGTVTVSRFDEK
jgi:hypothetical protein